MSDAIEITAAIAVVVGDRRRPRILQLLEQTPRTAAAVGELLGISAAAASHHLTVLQEHGWVQIAGTDGGGRSSARLWAATPGISWAQVTAASTN